MESVRFLIMSDTHDNHFPDPKSLPPCDVLLHCGDLTQAGGASSLRKAFENIKTTDAELKLVIAGNHDLSLDRSWFDEDDEEPDEAMAVVESFAPEVTYLHEGTHTFTLKSGATFSLYASPYTPEFGDFAFMYPDTVDRFNHGAEHPISDGVDIVMTHGPPSFPLQSPNPQTDDGEEVDEYSLDLNHVQEHCGCPKLYEAIKRARPKLHCFGHIHEGYGVQLVDWTSEVPALATISLSGDGNDEDGVLDGTELEAGEETLLVNAAIQAHDSTVDNEPIVVDLMLRRTSAGEKERSMPNG